jgi:hypothetical protein
MRRLRCRFLSVGVLVLQSPESTKKVFHSAGSSKQVFREFDRNVQLLRSELIKYPFLDMRRIAPKQAEFVGSFDQLRCDGHGVSEIDDPGASRSRQRRFCLRTALGS